MIRPIVVILTLGACHATQPPAVTTKPQNVEHAPPTHVASAPIAKQPDDYETLSQSNLKGPESNRDSLCTSKCQSVKVIPGLPGLAVELVRWRDQSEKRAGVTTTGLLLSTPNGHYRLDLFQDGAGSETREMVTPQADVDAGKKPGFAHRDLPVSYAGKIHAIHAIQDQKTLTNWLAIESARSDGEPLRVLTLCTVADGGVRCSELASDPTVAPTEYSVNDSTLRNPTLRRNDRYLPLTELEQRVKGPASFDKVVSRIACENSRRRFHTSLNRTAFRTTNSAAC